MRDLLFPCTRCDYGPTSGIDLQINKGEFNAAVVKCLGLIRQAVKCRQFERPAAAAATDGIGGNKAAIAAIMKEFNDIISSVKEV